MRAQNTSSIGLFYKSVGMVGMVFDYEELVGGYSQEMIGLTLREGLVFDEVIVRLHLNFTARGRCHYHNPPSGLSRQVLHLCLPRHINIISFSLLLRQ